MPLIGVWIIIIIILGWRARGKGQSQIEKKKWEKIELKVKGIKEGEKKWMKIRQWHRGDKWDWEDEEKLKKINEKVKEAQRESAEAEAEARRRWNKRWW